jgi:cyclophilin family peptidyl-prolyl cis-trans isomerase
MSQKKAKGRGTVSRRVALIEAERRRAKRQKIVRRTLQIGVPVAVIGLGLIIVLSLTGSKESPAANTNASIATTTTLPVTTTTLPVITPTVTSCSEASGTISGKPQFPTPPVMMINPAKTYTAKLETTSGTITTQLSPTIAPVAVNSFVFLAKCGFFDDTPISRVAKDFVIQLGDPGGTRTGGPGYTIDEEKPKTPGYPIGALAMANSGSKRSTGSQFFVVTGAGGATLPNDYSLFGFVTSGQEVAKAIENIPSEPPGDGAPTQPVKVVKVTIEEK